MLKKCSLIIIVIIMILIAFIYRDLNKNKIEFQHIKVSVRKNASNYAEVQNEIEFVDALNNDKIKIINVLNDLDLGFNYLNSMGVESKYILKHKSPLTHPILIEKGVSNIMLDNRNGLIITSSNGSKILHPNIRIINSNNVKIENIEMDELWEWDEKTKAEYDRNDWDNITIKNSNNVVINHCEFNKSYDGIIDIKNSNNVMIEYCIVNKVNEKFFDAQFQELEKNIDLYPMYKYLRKNMELSVESIKNLSRGQTKLFLIGPVDYGSTNKNIIIHDSIFNDVKSRVPLARNSSVYVHDIIASGYKYDIRNILTEEQYKLIRNKYHAITIHTTLGVNSIQRSYVVIENSIYDNFDYPYINERDKKYKNLGRIVIRNHISPELLKEKLNKSSGVRRK